MNRRRTAGRRPAWPGVRATKRRKCGRACGSGRGSSCRRLQEGSREIFGRVWLADARRTRPLEEAGGVDDDDAVEPCLEDVRHGERVAVRAPATRSVVRWIKWSGASDLQPDS